MALLNLLTDVAGLRVGNADDARLKSGVTVVVCDRPAVGSAHVMGGAPGTRETELLQPDFLIEAVDAIVLSGGSACGLGSASTRLDSGITVAALAAVNPVGSATIADTAHFWAAPFEVDREYGGRGLPHPLPADTARVRLKGPRSPGRPGENTTLAVVATDARLTKRDCKRLAVMAHDGFARALYPVHTPIDGDI